MSDIVEKLNDEADRLERRAYGDRCTGPDCALASNVAHEAADEIERLRKRVERWRAIKEIAEGVGNELVREERARLAEAVEMLKPFALYGSFGGEDCYNVRVRSQDARAARDFLAKLEGRT